MRHYFPLVALLLALGSAGCRSAEVATSQSAVRDRLAGEATPWWEKHRVGTPVDSTSYSQPLASAEHSASPPPPAGSIRLMRPEALHPSE